MLKTLVNQSRDTGVKVIESSIRRHISYRGVTKAIKSCLFPQGKLPYRHVCQIGDPVLRAHAQPVEREIIKTSMFQQLIKQMTEVMRKYKATGISAPQVGVSYQIFIMEITDEDVKGWKKKLPQVQKVESLPLKVFVNPKMKIIDYGKIEYTEGCLSILGFSAIVPRAQAIQIEAYDASGEPFVWRADGWTARIAQHEMDHLQGVMYVDKMDPKTFACTSWRSINFYNGNAAVRYYPGHWLRRYFLS